MSGSKIVDHYDNYEFKMASDNLVGNYETFSNGWWIDSEIKYESYIFASGIDPYRDRYHINIVLSLPVPFKGNPSQLAFLKPKVESYIDALKTTLYNSGSDGSKINELIKTLLTGLKTDYARRLTNNLKEWNNYLKVKRYIAERKAKNADKLPGSEYWNSIYAGGSNFCPLNSFVPGSPPAGFIYAGDKRFHQFILKQGE